MDREELMELAAKKANNEHTWDEIEFLFKPRDMGALLLRLNFGCFYTKIMEAFVEFEPNPLILQNNIRFKDWVMTVKLELFYIKCKIEHENRSK